MIRKAVVQDADALAGLMSQLGYPTTDAAMQERLPAILEDESYGTFVAEADGDVVGVIGMRTGRYYERPGLFAQIVVLTVDESVRGRGVGRALVAAAEKWAQGCGVQAIVVHSGRQRTEAHAFYESVGYVPTGIRFVKALGSAV